MAVGCSGEEKTWFRHSPSPFAIRLRLAIRQLPDFKLYDNPIYCENHLCNPPKILRNHVFSRFLIPIKILVTHHSILNVNNQKIELIWFLPNRTHLVARGTIKLDQRCQHLLQTGERVSNSGNVSQVQNLAQSHYFWKKKLFWINLFLTFEFII